MLKKINHIIKKLFVTYTKKIDENDKKYKKVNDHCCYTGKYRVAAYNICNLRYKTPKKVPLIFHNVSTNDYPNIIKELAEELVGQFKYLGENTKKYIIFSISITKRLHNGKTITYKIKIISSFRFISSSLSSLADNLSEGRYVQHVHFIIRNAHIARFILTTYQLKIIN